MLILKHSTFLFWMLQITRGVHSKKSKNVLTYATFYVRTAERLWTVYDVYGNRLWWVLTHLWTLRKDMAWETWMHRCANSSMRDSRTFYPSASCDLPLQGGFRLARRLVSRKRSSGCVAVTLPSSRVSSARGCLFTGVFLSQFDVNAHMYFEVISFMKYIMFRPHVFIYLKQ